MNKYKLSTVISLVFFFSFLILSCRKTELKSRKDIDKTDNQVVKKDSIKKDNKNLNPKEDKSKDDKSKDDKSKDNKSKDDKSKDDKSKDNKPKDDKSKDDKPNTTKNPKPTIKDDDKNKPKEDKDKATDISEYNSQDNIKEDPSLYASADPSVPIYQEHSNREMLELLQGLNPMDYAGLDGQDISTEHYDLIAKEVLKDIKGISAKQSADKMMKWMKKIKYGHNVGGVPVNMFKPYQVYTKLVADCFGYSNLAKTMFASMKIPCLIVKGWIYGVGSQSHAWTFEYLDNQWYVYDFLHKRSYSLKDKADPKNKGMLTARIIDYPLFKDDKFVYNYNDGLNISQIIDKAETISLPYSAKNVVVTSFLPYKELPKTAKILYIPMNITNLGSRQWGTVTIDQYDKSLVAIFVDSRNPKLESYHKVLYNRGENKPLHIPYAMDKLVLKPMQTLERKFIYGLPMVKEIVVDRATKLIEDDAVLECPNLRIVKIPRGCRYTRASFGNNPNLKLIEY